MQSGNDKGLFAPSEDQQTKIHSKEITGLGMDSLNHYLVSCSLDGTIKLWDFYR
jgi:WD40 repeat protein